MAETLEVECVATVLPLRHWWDLIAFLRLANRIDKQISSSPGYIAHNTRGDVAKKTFWTVSVWRDRASVRAFVATEPHATALRRVQRWSGERAAFAEWRQASPDVDWIEVERRLERPTFYSRPRQRT